MIKNYFLIALRNIRRHIGYTLINISGLTLGITCSLVLFLLVTFLTGFDKDHPLGDRTYRVVNSSKNQDRLDYGAGVPNPMPEAVHADIAGLEAVMRISGDDEVLVTVEHNGAKKIFKEAENFAFTDSTYFTLINQKILAGSGLLRAANEAVITRRLAGKYFGDEDPLGRTVRIDNLYDATITGIMEAPADNASFPFEFLVSFETVRKNKLDEGWGSVSSNDQCFVLLEPGVDPATVNAQFPAFTRKYRGEDPLRDWTYWLQPVTEIHYDTRISNFRNTSVGVESIWAMGIIGVFLVVTACINFINLTTAVAVKRSKEVGIRKVLGSHRRQLVFQHLSETALITLLALFISVGLAELALLRLNAFLHLDLHISFGNMQVFLILTWLLVSVVAGLYPAFLLSGYSPAAALKNAMTNRGSGGYGLRRGLVVFQFMISQFLIVGTIILLAQMSYVNSKDLGFARDAIITVPLPEAGNNGKKRNLKSEVSMLPGADDVSLCYMPPASDSRSVSDFSIDGVEGDYLAQLKASDAAYAGLFDLELVAGRNLAESDTMQGWLVNERLVKAIGLNSPEEVLGRNLELWQFNLPVVGVVKDFHTVSLEEAIDPVILYNDISGCETLAVKLKAGQLSNSIQAIEKAWTEQYPDFLFSYEFLDLHIAGFYESMQKMFVLLMIFCGIAVTIGCLGLYGLVSFMATQKEKEIGVRKVLGATTAQIMLIFSKEFSLLVVIAFALSAPLAGYIMGQWLQNFAYHIPLGWPMFAAGIFFTLLIAFVTVGYRSLRAAGKNPVEILRTE